MAQAGVHPGILASLTPLQIAEIYAHPCDEHGRLIPPRLPEGPLTCEEEVARAEAAMAAFGVCKADRAAVHERIRGKHGRADR